MTANKSEIAVRIETNDKNEILVKRILYKRFSFHGFGSFIWGIKPEEISVSQKALDLLKKRIGHRYTSMGDLSGMSLDFNTQAADPKYRGMNFNYGYLGPKLKIPIEDVIIDRAGYEMLEKTTITDHTLDQDPEDIERWENILKLDKENKDDEVNQIIEEFYTTKN